MIRAVGEGALAVLTFPGRVLVGILAGLLEGADVEYESYEVGE